MNWEAVGAIAEALGAAGVVVSLIYLASQVRQSNILARNQARQTWMQLDQADLHKIVDNPSVNLSFVEQEISVEDKIRLMEWLGGALRAREFQWFQYQDGIIDEAYFRTHAGVITIVLGTERTRRWWAHAKGHFDPGFVAFADDLLADAPLTDYFDLDAW